MRFAVIGITHGHIYGQVRCLLDAGATLVSWHAYAHESTLTAAFARAFPQAQEVADERAILEDASIDMVVTSTVPADRAPLAIRAMRHGKDVMTDKPGVTSLDQLDDLREAQAESGRIFSVCFSERFENRATTRAAELVRAGAIGRVLQTIGLGPHRANLATRLPYFFERERYGGILCDIGAHQFDQFLYFTGSTRAEVVASQIGNVNHPQHPGLEDFGDCMLSGNGGSGYFRVDWFTPDGLPVWGDGRLTVLGTDGYVEIRKYVDIGGQPGADHLFLVDKTGVRRIECEAVELPYGRQLITDVRERSETAMSQAHCFLACELALRAQDTARVL